MNNSVSSIVLNRAFRFILSAKARWYLHPARQNRAAYERYFASVLNSGVLRWLHLRINLVFPVGFEEYALGIISKIFTKRHIQPFYLPIEWFGQPLAREIHLAKPSIFLSRHDKFAFGSHAILEQGGDVVAIAVKPHKHAGRFKRSGIAERDRITILNRDAMALVNLRKEMAMGKHASCFVDDSMYIYDGLFKFARLCGSPVYFLSFTVNNKGRIVGEVDGPVDCSDIAAAMERFRTFSRAPHRLSISNRSGAGKASPAASSY